MLGAAGGIGQPLSLLFKTSNLVDNLNLYDVVNVPGVAADLSHISTPPKVKGFAKDQLADALKGMDVVVIPAGVPRKPGMTRDDLFNTNATIVKTLAESVAKYGAGWGCAQSVAWGRQCCRRVPRALGQQAHARPHTPW